jgi:hypothetical protein
MSPLKLINSRRLLMCLALCMSMDLGITGAHAFVEPTIPEKTPLFVTNPIRVRGFPSFVGEAVNNLQGKSLPSFQIEEGVAVEFTGEISENLRPGEIAGVWIRDDNMQLTWYQLHVLTGEHRGKKGWVQNKRLEGKPVRLKVAIFALELDGAFHDAAKTSLKKWEESCHQALEMKSAARSPFIEWYLYIPVSSASQLATAWKSIAETLRANNSFAKNQQSQVLEVHIFTHASYESRNDGLEFKDGTFDYADLLKLELLQWPKDSERTARVFLHGCNTGVYEGRDWSPAQVVADQQKVGVQGELGFSYFSADAAYYRARETKGSDCFLKAFNRGMNKILGDGKAIEPIIALPASSSKSN